MRFMKNMQVYSKYVILVPMILALSIFTIFSISEVHAAENIFVDVHYNSDQDIYGFQFDVGDAAEVFGARTFGEILKN